MKFFRIVLVFLFGLLIFGCNRRKKAPTGLADWLEMHFPNRFQILESRTVDPIRNLSFKVKKSIVAEKTDTLLQIEVKWDARAPDLGLSPGEIDSLFAQAKPELDDARSLFDALKTAGISKVSASILNGYATVLIFEEPTPAHRERFLNDIKTVFLKWPLHKNYGIWLVFMEPSAFQTEFGDIVPLGHWVRPDGWQRQKGIISLQFQQHYAFDLEAMGKAWTFNTESDRLGAWVDQARPIAERWATEQLKKPIALKSLSEYESLDKKMGVKIKFAFSDQPKLGEDAPISGYVAGDFLLDKGIFEKLRMEKE